MDTSCPQKMLPHVRRRIRHRIRDLLKEYVDVSGRVFLSRPHPVFLTELPCLFVYFADESIESKSSEPRYLTRKLHVYIDVLQADRPNIAGDSNEELDDYMDSRAFEIEYALLKDRYLGLPKELSDPIHNVDLTAIEAVDVIFEGEQNTQGLRLVFEITYETSTVYSGSLDEFLRFESEYKTVIGAEAKDHVIIRTE